MVTYESKIGMGNICYTFHFSGAGGGVISPFEKIFRMGGKKGRKRREHKDEKKVFFAGKHHDKWPISRWNLTLQKLSWNCKKSGHHGHLIKNKD